MPGLSGGAGPDSFRQQNCAELSRPSYVVYSATTDPTRDRTERFTCLRFVHPGMLHEKSHLKCPIGQTLAKSNEKWTSNLRSYTTNGQYPRARSRKDAMCRVDATVQV